MTTVAPTELEGRGRPDREIPDDVLRHPWALVARREVATKLVDRTFLVGTLLTMAMIVAFVVVQAVLSDRIRDHDLVATASAAPMADAVAAQATDLDDRVRVTVVDVADDAAAEAALREDDADAWLTTRDGTWVLVARDEVPRDLESVTATVVRDAVLAENASAAGTSVEAITAGAELSTDVLIGDAEQRDFAQGMAFALAFLFYLSSIIFGTTLANSVVEEKQSRIVEIIATKIPVRQLLAGKVLGNTALAVGQMALYAALGLVGLGFTSLGSFLPSVTGALGWFLVFFLVGFLLIACLWAVAGALASRTEDVQSTSTPVTMLLLAIFFGSAFLDGTAQTVLSYVPPASAVIMPQRILEGTAAWWEPFVALAVLLVAAGVVVLAAERLYRRSLLQTQGRISMRQAWSAPE
ncbi:MAG TPA: ABC transporter permease [Ornithinibacter sp.]|nr:ABC transporter permease [Ornithinibacter sp.]